MKTIVKMVFGSFLYGTDTPESDKDYKGVFLPEWKDIILNRVPKSITNNTKSSTYKNTKDDVDMEMYSLHYFLELACKGETVALDMLHAPDNMIIEKSDIWDKIVKNRDKFYTRNLKAFIGYARKQASKYGVKGSRLSDSQNVVDYLKTFAPVDRKKVKLKDYWVSLPEGEHIYKLDENPNGLREYQVCGRKVQENVTVEYALGVFEQFYKNYGARARDAAQNKNIDWKAVSHAVRAALQIKQLLLEGTITFPLRDAEWLKQIKKGELDYLGEVAPILEGIMDDVESFSLTSGLPEKVDRTFWDQFIIKIYEDVIIRMVGQAL